MKKLICSALLAFVMAACGGSANSLPEAILGNWVPVDVKKPNPTTFYKEGDRFFMDGGSFDIPLKYHEQENIMSASVPNVDDVMKIRYIPETGNLRVDIAGISKEYKRLSEKEAAELKEKAEDVAKQEEQPDTGSNGQSPFEDWDEESDKEAARKAAGRAKDLF